MLNILLLQRQFYFTALRHWNISKKEYFMKRVERQRLNVVKHTHPEGVGVNIEGSEFSITSVSQGYFLKGVLSIRCQSHG